MRQVFAAGRRQAGMAPALIDYFIGRFEAEADEGLASRLAELAAAERRLMHKDQHKH